MKNIKTIVIIDTYLKTQAMTNRCCGTYEVFNMRGVSDLMQVRNPLSLRRLSSITVLKNRKFCQFIENFNKFVYSTF